MSPEQIEVERKAFEAWAVEARQARREADGEIYSPLGVDGIWKAWLARAEKAQRVREALEAALLYIDTPTNHTGSTDALIRLGNARRVIAAALKD